MSRKRTLEIDEDLHFQQKEWFLQRIGFALLCMFTVILERHGGISVIPTEDAR